MDDTDTTRPRPRGLRDEEGAVAALVILGIAALLGAALVAIDGGSVLHTRRGLIADTDAAALATAIELLDDRCASDSTARGHAESMVAVNDPETAVRDVTVDRRDGCTAGHGTVAVATANAADLFFAPAFGIDQLEAEAVSVAEYGSIRAMVGLRPIGLCSSDPHYREWATLLTTLRTPPASDDAGATLAYDALAGSGPEHPAYAAAGTVHRVPFQRLGIGACDLGTPAGNWGWLDFDGGSNSNRDLDRWIEDGYDGEVDLGGPGSGDESCDDTEAGFEDCDATTGGRGRSTAAALDTLVCPAGTAAVDCDVIYIVVFDAVNDGDGANTEFHPSSFVGLVLRGHDVGTGRALGESSWIDIEFVDELTQGRIGASSPVDPDPGPRGVQLCATDHFDAC